ncbi:uncharacterized protein LDX57_008454 [Aspergillus melleus]|uniref:uncharacterized protein n=1 Tax=Aspergillus melleus TaxID=138277 RepID=UPI001E8D604A|nr:uncharacterized protein LDX57_008454 [Aspergillus melleus]KAH8430791.1 hypothetical protein LDX57_008454 [Aspergillus melleus]
MTNTLKTLGIAATARVPCWPKDIPAAARRPRDELLDGLEESDEGGVHDQFSMLLVALYSV